MRDFKDTSFSERLLKASAARQAMVQRAQKPADDDPRVLQRKTERQALVAVRDARKEEKARAAIERAAREKLEEGERAAASERMAREEADRESKSRADQKALRDVRYAARKNRRG